MAFQDYLGANWGTILSDTDLDAALATPGPVWIVVAFPARTFRAIPSLQAAVESDLDLVRAFPGTLGDGAVLVYRRP